MLDVDLSHVDPRRLAETKRRTALVREYASIAHPSGKDAKRFATELGLSPSQLSRLVKAWREYGRLPGGIDRQRRSEAVMNSRRGVPEASKHVVEHAVKSLGLDARYTDLARIAREACMASGVTAPAPATIWLIIQKLRDERDAQTAQSHRGVLVARCRLEMKVQFGEVVTMPEALIAVALPECRVIRAHLLAPTAEGSGFAHFAHALATQIGFDVNGRPLLTDLDSTGQGSLPSLSPGILLDDIGTSALSLLIQAIGRRLDTILIVPIKRKRVPARLDRAVILDLNQANDAILHAVDRHNERKPALTDLQFLIKS